ncbi:hypothetical protein Y032_0052g2212 [Ancylostoma ceylanicum]|nr:hypothetical protein Y032_0052g2212 [Ancylostoma ceylanicum]
MYLYVTILTVLPIIHQAEAQCCDPNPTPNYSRMLRGIPRDARKAFRAIQRVSFGFGSPMNEHDGNCQLAIS